MASEFAYDMTPWKLVMCRVAPFAVCMEDGPRVALAALPEAPEPGRIPEGCDHVHIRKKFSADQRNTRIDQQWRALVLATSRCEHGRLQLDNCVSCPTGMSPDRSGTRIGTAYDGSPVVIPAREAWNDIKAWTPERIGA
jgi:hypothetical protein